MNFNETNSRVNIKPELIADEVKSVSAVVEYDTRKNTYEYIPNDVKKAVCLVSGGMDSATCLFHMVKNLGADNVVALSLFYGQKSACELRAAEAECKKLGVKRCEMNISDIFKFNVNYSSYLQGSDKEIEDKEYVDILKEKIDAGEAPISPEYIPNRNSLLLNIAASIGLQLFNNEKFAIVTGIHNDDALKGEGSNIAVYPDCSLDFANSINKTLQFATAGLVFIYTPLANMSKTEVAKFGVENGMTKEDFNNTWSCYKGKTDAREKPCGKCPTDRDRIRALLLGANFTKDDILAHYDINSEEFNNLYGKYIS